MKKITFTTALLLVTLLTSSISLAQKSAVTTGIVEYESGNYERALEKINQGLQNSEDLKEEMHAKALLYKGKSLIAITSQAAQNKDQAQLAKYSNSLLDAYNAFLNASKLDVKDRYLDEVKSAVRGMYSSLLQMGISYLNAGDYGIAIDYTNAAVSANDNFLKKDIYFAYDLRAQSHLGLGDSTQAHLDFNDCIARYNKEKPIKPDMYIGYAYYRLTLLYRYKDDNIDAALGTLQEGLKLVNNEFERLKLQKNNYSTENWAQLEVQQANVTRDLKAFELDIYLNYPDKYSEALLKFKSAVADEPSNIMVRLAYANLLEKSDEATALIEYRKVIELDPENFTANFNIGALFVNKAVKIYQEANSMDDFQEANDLMEQANKEYANALPFLKKSHQLAPRDITVIRSLKQITLQLDLVEEYQYYKQLEENL